MASLLLRSGLALTPRSLRAQAADVARLALLPALGEGVSIALLARGMLGMPWTWSFLLG